MFKNTYTYISMLFFLGSILILVSTMIINKESSALKYSTFEVKPQISDDIKVDYNQNENGKTSIKFSFIGDSLLASFKGSGEFQELLDNHDYNYPYKNVIDIFKSDDFTIANGENVFTDNNLSPTPKDYNPAYWYYTKSKYANVYRESSIELVSIMNNHTYDYGNQGYLDTIKALKDADVLYGGEEAVILNKDGFKIGVICANLFHDFQGDEINDKIKSIKNKVNYVIVYFHGGTEYLYTPPENIKSHSHSFIDNGADLVIGAHPHVLQPIETYKDKKIVYSLGSFLFGGTTTLVNRTIIYQMNIEYDKDSNTYKETDNIIPCYLYSSNTGYEKWLPSVIQNETEKQQVLDFMNEKRATPF